MNVYNDGQSLVMEYATFSRIRLYIKEIFRPHSQIGVVSLVSSGWGVRSKLNNWHQLVFPIPVKPDQPMVAFVSIQETVSGRII